MKLLNKIIAFASAGVMVVSAAGCSGGAKSKIEVTDSNVTQVVNEAVAKLAAVNESKAVMTVDFNLKTDSESSSAVTVTEVKNRRDPGLMFIKTSGTQDGKEIDNGLETYIEKTEESYNIYMPYEGTWYKQDIGGDYIEYIFSQYYVTENVISILNNVDKIKYEGEEKVGNTDAYKITCEIPANKTYEVAEGTSIFFNIGLSGLQEELYDVKDPVPVTLWLNSADGTIVKMDMDYTKALKDIINAVYTYYETEFDDEMGRLDTDKYFVSIELSDYENLKDFSIPDDIKNAKGFGESGDVTVDE